MIYEVDPVKLAKLADKTKSPVAELLKLNGFQPPKDAGSQSAVNHAIRDESLSFDVHGQDVALAFKRMMAPTVTVVAGHQANVVNGGQFPILVNPGLGRDTELGWRDFGTKLAITPIVDLDGRLVLDVRVEDARLGEDPGVEVKGVKIPSLNTRALSLAVKLKSGQSLLVANGTSKTDLTQFVQLTPRLLTQAEIAAMPLAQPPALPSAKPAPRPAAWVVEEDFPQHDLKVGQMVFPAFIFLRESKAIARVASDDDMMMFKVAHISIRSDTEQVRRVVTLELPTNDAEVAQQWDECRSKHDDLLRAANVCCLLPIPVTEEELDFAPRLRDVLTGLPKELQPKPISLSIGEQHGLKFASKDPAGNDDFELLDYDDTFIALLHQNGWNRVLGRQPGFARLVYSSEDGHVVTKMEYRVKADTRELELHIRQQFPTAKVTISSLGANSLMLSGTFASEEDSRGIVELAEQFAPKVLNRLKVGAVLAAEPDTARRMGTPARPIELTAADDSEETGKSAHPPKQITPAAAKAPKKSEQLQQLRDEIRELRQEVRELIQRLDREQAGTLKNNDDAKPAIKLGRNDLEFNKLIQEFNDLMEQQRFAEAEVIAKQAVELDPNNPLPQTMTFKAAFARRVADNAKLVIKTYSVAALVVPVQPLHLRFRVDDNKAKLVGLPKPVPPANSLAQLLEMITSTIAPDSWEEAGGHGKMTVNDSTLSLVVSQTPAVHDELRSTLELLRTVSVQQVSLELRVIKTAENFHGFGFDLPLAWTQLKPNEGKLLNSKDADALIAAAQQERRTSLFSLPKLTLMTGQPMTLDVDSGSLPAPLHLSGFAMPLASDGHRFTRLHLSARGTDEQSAAHNLTTVRDGHSLLINLTNVIQSGNQEGVPILNKVPNVARLFKNVSATKSLKPGEQLFLLATPRVLAPEAEEESLLGVPE